jgi:glucosamine--fructose-6-phosphate aminotransferase (isomerizing)
MCGIVGYVGTRSAAELIGGGLKRLEYRDCHAIEAAIP